MVLYFGEDRSLSSRVEKFIIFFYFVFFFILFVS